MGAELPQTGRGFVNAHTHIYSALAPLGLLPPEHPPENFIQILGRIWWRLDRALDEQSLAAAARLYAAESLLHGTTTLVDHHESPNWIDGSLEVIANACDELGIRALLCFGATERNGGRGEAQRGLGECRRFLRSNRRPLVRGAVGLHAPFTVSDDTIREAGALCTEFGAVLHVHVAEDRIDLDDAVARRYTDPIDRLQALGGLPPGAILAHGVHLEHDAVKKAEDLGCWFVQNPRSNANNRVGYPRALGSSTRVALGTDGFPSDLRAEAASLFAESARNGEDRAVAGRRIDAGHAMVAELFGSVDDACTWSENGTVAALSVAGRTLVRDGVLVTGDLDEIRRRAEEAMPGLRRRMADLS